jgi:hypothetical protein
MARIGIIIVIAIIIASMGAAMYTYTQYQTNFIVGKMGDPVVVGPVEYVITFDGTHKGNIETIPEDIFVKIKIIAKNISNEQTRITGGQFYLVDEKQQKHQATYGKFSADDLLDYMLEPNKPMMFTTQFDVPYDEQTQFNVTILPTKQHSSLDTAVICFTNC